MRRAPSGMTMSELTLLSLHGCFRFPGLDLLFRRLPRRDAPASAILFLGQWNHLLSSVPIFAVRARRHPQMQRFAKSGGSRYTWKLFSAILTIRSWSFLLPS